MYLEKSVFSFEVSLVNKFGVFELSKKQLNKNGIVKKIYVKNETPVEFGEPLVLIE